MDLNVMSRKVLNEGNITMGLLVTRKNFTLRSIKWQFYYIREAEV
jgi:hypothetical protein